MRWALRLMELSPKTSLSGDGAGMPDGPVAAGVKKAE